MDENELPEGWVWTTLGEIRFDLAKGIIPNNFPEQFFELYSVPNFDLGIPEIIQGKDIKSNKQIIESETVLLCKINPRINRAWVVGNFSEYIKIASTEWIPFFKESMILPTYLCYYLRSNSIRDYFAANASGVGGSLMRINDQTVAVYPFPLAPLPEQNRIVAAIEQQFTRLDNAVASLKSAQARTKQYRASLLKSAVEGELTKEWRATHPASETGAQLLTRILAERRKRWEEAELAKMREKGITPTDNKWKEKYKEPEGPDTNDLPKLPEGWCWVSLEQCSRRITDGTHQPPQFVDSGIPFIFVKHIVKGQISFEDTRYISQETYQTLNSRCPVETGDILYSAVGSYGVAVPILISQPFSFQRHIAHIKPSFLINLKYLVFCLNSSVGLEQAHRFARGVAQKTVTLTDLARFVIPLPPLAEQEQIVLEVEAALSNIAKLEEATEHSLTRAEHERQSILHEAFAGRLVPQDPQDEPASVLLERIRAERKQREESDKIVKAGRRETRMDIAKKRRVRKTGDGTPDVGLYEKLVEVGKPMSPEELFKAVGLQTDDQPESTEVFYAEARADINDKLIAETRPAYNQVLAEALEPSTEMLERMQAEEEAESTKEAALQKNKLQKPTLWDI